MAALTPAALVVLLAFLWLRSRKNPLFLAGAAAFIGLGRSAYINIVPDQVLRQVGPLELTAGDVLFAALVLGWLYARQRRAALRVRLSSKWVVLGVCVAYFLALELALVYANAGGFHPMLILLSRNWFYIPCGYLLTLDILRRFTADETAQYVGVLSLFTTCLMVLYIASALGAPIYPYSKYLATSFAGTAIIRDFTTFPIWMGLAWAYYLSQPKRSAWAYVALAVLAAGTLLSYTRSLILELAVVVLLVVILQMVQQARRAQALIIAVVAVAFLGILLVGGPVLAPAQYKYLGARLGEVDQPGKALSNANVRQYRLQLFERAQKAGAQVDHLLGAGLLDPTTSVASQQYNSYDSDWIRIVYYTGWAGVAVLAMPLVLAIVWGVKRFVSRGGSAGSGTLLLTGVLATVFSFAVRFTGQVYFWWPAVSLFPVALVAYGLGIPAVGSARDSGASVPHRVLPELGGSR